MDASGLVLAPYPRPAGWAAAAACGGSAQQQRNGRPIIVRDLVIEGNRRVQEAVILGRIQSKPGSPFSPTQLSEDVRSVFGLGACDMNGADYNEWMFALRYLAVVAAAVWAGGLLALGAVAAPSIFDRGLIRSAGSSWLPQLSH